jgi:hypothetical protein
MFRIDFFDEPLREGLSFRSLEAEHFFAIDLQDSQRTQYGLDPTAISEAEAQHYAGQASAWAALRRAGDAIEVLAIVGVQETFPGAQGVVFALLGKGIGRDHHALTRFVREVVIGGSDLARLEAIVRCADPHPEAEGSQLGLMTHALQNPTPPVRWALACGLDPVCVLRKFGAAGETHMLFERIR